MKVNKIAELKKAIVDTIKNAKDIHFPEMITFNSGIENPQYLITIEEIQHNVFVDSRGVKWRRVIDEDKGENEI